MFRKSKPVRLKETVKARTQKRHAMQEGLVEACTAPGELNKYLG